MTPWPRWCARNLKSAAFTPDDRLPRICGLFKDRCDTTVVLADWAAAFYADITPHAAEKAQHVTDAIRPALALLVEKLAACAWDKASICGGHQGSSGGNAASRCRNSPCRCACW